MTSEPTVFVVDDDTAVSESLRLLLHAVGRPVSSYLSGQEFLESYDPARPGCLVLDMRMPGMSGLDVIDRLHQRGICLPTIVITGHADVPMAVRAMQGGVIDFLEKPFNGQDLIDRVQSAIERDAQQRGVEQERATVRRRLDLLTAGEQTVLEQIIAGKSNKEIAAQLGLSRRGVEARRANLMNKMQADSLVELVRLTLFAQASSETSPAAPRQPNTE